MSVSIGNRGVAGWSWAVIGLAAVLLGALSGRSVAQGDLLIPLMAMIASFGVAVFARLGLGGWCSILLVSTVASRALVAFAGFPTLINYIHYPLVLAFALAAFARRGEFDRRGSARPARWLLSLVLLSAASAVTNWTHPLRLLIFLAIFGEPLVVIWAIQRWGPDRRAERTIAWTMVVLMIVQVPIGLWQGLTLGFADPVQGTLTGHGAGHHVLGGLFAVSAAIVAAAGLSHRLPIYVALPVGLVCLAMVFATGANSVMLAAGVALVVAMVTRPRKSADARVRGRLGPLVFASGFLLLTFAIGSSTVPRFDERMDLLTNPDQFPIRKFAEERSESIETILLGSGPGTTGSRASLLLTPQQQSETSPLAGLGLEATEDGLRIAATTLDAYGGSAESWPSSALGMFGDLGMVGIGALIMLLVRLWIEVGRVGRWLAPSSRTALVMVGVLMFVDNWLEYPEFAVPLAVLIGLALARPVEDERAPG